MNSKMKKILQPGVRLYFLILILFAAATFFFGNYRKELAIAELGLIAVLFIYSLIVGAKRKKTILNYIETVSYNVDSAVKDTLKNFPLPMVVFTLEDNRIVTANSAFLKMTGRTEHFFERSIEEDIPGFHAKWLLEGKSEAPELISVDKKSYRVFGSLVRSEHEQSSGGYIATTYWVDVTEARNIEEKFIKTRPVFAILMFDNYDEFLNGMSEKDKSAVLSDIDDRISDWAGKCNGYLSKYDRDRYIFLFEEQYLQQFVDARFSLLDTVREVRNTNGQKATLSIGIGKDAKTFAEGFKFAALGIDMALSRGGDQAVIKNRFTFEFYGGRSPELEKRTKVKARVMANSLTELIRDASQILIMGHKYADLDSVGASVGLICAAKKLQKPAFMVVDPEKNAAKQLIGRLQKLPAYANAFISSQDAILAADNNTLLVVVDTNRPEQTESEELLASCNKVAVIDHHRRAATYIENAALSFHEPYASSASELVSELLQYICDPSDIMRAEAESLMAGIVLDTKNFTLRTGGRTFEAAAFLRRAGADPTEVKKLLQSDIATAMARYSIIQKAKVYKAGIAIATADTAQNRIIAAQAADELLNISGIEASFVIHPEGEAVCISARSIGDVNVQVILEKLGGGGNKSTAGAQVRGKNENQVLQELVDAIDSFLADGGMK